MWNWNLKLYYECTNTADCKVLIQTFVHIWSETDMNISTQMDSTTILYDNQTFPYLFNTTNYPAQSAYLLSSTRFVVYTVARWCQVCIGIPANIMTLLIIKRLRVRLNMHIIMVYMAVSDIFSLTTLPVGTYISASQAQVILFKDHWDNFCILKSYFDMIALTGSMVSYFMLSIDR